MNPIISTWWTVSVIWTMQVRGYIWAAMFFEYLDIKDTQLYILSILMVVDFIAWVSRQYVIDKSDITSHKARLWLVKKISTLILVICLAIMFKWIWLDWSEYIETILAIFIMAEMYSIVRSVYTIRTWELLPEYDVISKTIKKVWEFIWSLIDKKTK